MGIRLEISRSLVGRLRAEAAAAPGVEVCGLLFGEPDRIAEAQSCTNVSSRPADSFELDPAALLGAYRSMRRGGPRLIGYYHSHPTGQAEPSPRDAEAAAPDGMIWLIIGQDAVTAWRAGAEGLEGRFTPVELILLD